MKILDNLKFMAEKFNQVFSVDPMQYVIHLLRFFATKIYSLSNTILELIYSQPKGQHRVLVSSSSNVLLPLELESIILLRLPAKQLARCRTVSKRWHDEINSPHFIKTHSNQQNSNTGSIIIFFPSAHMSLSIDFHHSPSNQGVFNNVACHPLLDECFYPHDIVGSSNGLLCYRAIEHSKGHKITRFVIHNPVTGTYNIMPPLVHKSGRYACLNMVGFGYDCIGNDYKLLCTVKCRSIDDVYRAPTYEYNVYSLKTDSWKKVQPRHNVHAIWYTIMVLSNNMLHVIVPGDIFGFNLATEEFHKVTQPNYDNNEYNGVLPTSCALASVGGRLHLTKYIEPFTNYGVPKLGLFEGDTTIWVMNEYDGSKQSWTKLVHRISAKQLIEKGGLKYSGRFSYLPLPLAYSEDGSEILIGAAQSQYIENYVQCNVRSSELKKFEICSLAYDHCKTGIGCQALPWSGSLVELPYRSTERKR